MPQTTLGLVETITASIRGALQVPGNPVLIREIKYPELAEIAIDISGGKVRANMPHPFPPEGEGKPALTTQLMTLKATPLLIGDGELFFSLEANGVVLHRNRSDTGELFLQFQRVENGRLAIGVRQRDLEIFVDRLAKREAGKQGVAIEHMQLSLTSRGQRSLGVEIRVQARRLFVRALLRIAGIVKIDEQLVARISNVTCHGDGAMATLACSVLAPHLEALQHRAFPLLALPLGQVQVHDINLAVTDGIELTADFGTVAT